MNRKKIALGIIVGTLLVAPFATSALSITELQAQVLQLLNRITELRLQIANEKQPSLEPDIQVTAVPRICKTLSDRVMSIGMRNDDVRGLQEFLQGEGLLKAEATGYFGVATRDALRKWQVENKVVANANVNAGWGIAGPRTREALLKRCGNAGPITVSPAQGPAPLTVVVTAKVGDDGPSRPSFVDGQDTLIDFGDGTERQWVQCATVKNDQFGGTLSGSACRTPAEFKHTYAENGSYTVRLLQAGGMCMGGCPERLLGTAYVRVGKGPVACTMEYMPVCGEKQVTCITAPCNPVQQTYGNRCAMNADGATFVHEGACRDSTYNPEHDRTCKAWYDGCNSCSRSAPGEPAMCTLRACAPDSMTKPYCTAYFDGTSVNRAPVISQLSGPTSLNMNETGTWSVRASDPENGQLTYSIQWGDEWFANDSMRAFPASPSIQQESTFTHAYANSGTYTVRVTVSDAEGKTAESTATVQVGSTAYCTKEYAPVCGRPAGCMNTCAPGMYCTLQCQLRDPVTYSNRCMLNAAGSEFLYTGVCRN